MKIEKILKRIKIDSLLKNIKEKNKFYKYFQSVEETANKGIMMSQLAGAPISADKEINLKEDFYLFLGKIIPKKAFDWASRKY